MSRGYTPRHAQTAGDLSFAVQFNDDLCGISRSSAILGSDSPFQKVIAGGFTLDNIVQVVNSTTCVSIAKQPNTRPVTVKAQVLPQKPPLISQNKWPEISQMSTPISRKTLSNIFEGYDIDIIKSFYNGFTVGFHIQSEGNVSERISKNLKSAYNMPEIVAAKLSKELQANHIGSPSSSPPFSNFVCSPLGLVRKIQAGKFRLIHYLSNTHGDFILCKQA